MSHVLLVLEQQRLIVQHVMPQHLQQLQVLQEHVHAPTPILISQLEECAHLVINHALLVLEQELLPVRLVLMPQQLSPVVYAFVQLEKALAPAPEVASHVMPLASLAMVLQLLTVSLAQPPHSTL